MDASEIVGLFLAILAIIFFVAPTNWLMILLFNFLLSFLFFLFIKRILSLKFRILVLVFSFIILTLKSYGMFDLTNLFLTISLAIGLTILIK